MSRKRLIALLLAVLMIVGALAACANDGGTSPSPSQTPAATPTQKEETPIESEEPEDVNKLPIVEEKVTFTCWSVMFHQESFMKSFNETPAYKMAEKRTNIHIEWQHASSASTNEVFNLLIASQDYPDIIDNFATNYKNGLEKAVEDDIIIPLNDVIDQYVPNYDRLMDEKNVRLDIMTDSGLIAQFASINEYPSDAAFGFMIRKDWLDDLGMKMPVTYDDWHETLVAFRDEKNAEAPMLLNNVYACDSMFNNYKAGYQTSWSFFNQEGTVKYGPVTPEYKAWLEMMVNWYSEGLIDRDFATRDNKVFFIIDMPMMMSGKSGLWFGAARGNYTGNSAYTSGLTEDPNWYCTSIRNPVLNEGDEMHFRSTSDALSNGSVITVDCKDVPTVAKWFNYCYSEQGRIDLNYGIEDESYNMVDGEPVQNSQWFADTFKNDDFTVTRFCVGSSGGRGLYSVPIKNADVPLRPDYQIESTATIMQDGNDWAMPNFMSPTAEENSKLSTIMNDIETYVAERTMKIILGAESLDTWDAAVAQIKTMHVDEAIALKQAALDRYMARGK